MLWENTRYLYYAMKNVNCQLKCHIGVLMFLWNLIKAMEYD